LLSWFIKGADGFITSNRRGDIRRETRLYDYPIQRRDAFGLYDVSAFVAQMNAAGDLSQGRLRLDDDLLALESVTNGDGTAITLTNLVLEAPNLYPKSALRFKSGSGLYWLPGTDGTREQVINVTGWWGYHPQYDSAWVDSLDTVQDTGGISASATSIKVSDADGAAADLDSPRFQAGQLIKIESEFVSVISVNATSNTLTVQRAYNGTVAATHAKTTTIYLYRPYENLVLAATRFAVWRYRQKDANVFDKTVSFETGTTIIPAAVPADVRSLLPVPRQSI
jgi:hypothetical protein